MRVPLIMLLVNNHYAISTPVHRQTAAAELAARADGYGFPGFVVDEAKQRDPIERVRRFAIREGIWSAAQEAAALDEIRSEIEIAQRQVEELPRPGAAAIFEHVYETLSPRLQQQRAEALDDARPS